MTNRILDKFEKLKQNNEKALVGFVTAGDPSIMQSLKIIKAMCKAGLDVLELGVPFSDPTSDGPVIQRSSNRAITNGVTLKIVLDMTSQIRKYTDIPIILFSYYNPIFAYGNKKFYEDALESGADGVLLVDLPPEESFEMTSCWKANTIETIDNNLSLIRLIAPTTPLERMEKILASASGFIYLVSKTGVTGSDGIKANSVEKQVETLKSISKLPICVGFGISTPKDAREIGVFADGIVVGSAFEQIIEKNKDRADLPLIIAAKVNEFKQVLKF